MGSLRALVSTSAFLALIATASIDSANGQSIAWQRSAYGADDAADRPGCETATPTSAFVHGVDASGNLFVASCHAGLIRTAKLAASTGAELWSRTHLPSNLPPSLGTPVEAFGVPYALAVDGAGNVVVTGYTVNALGWHNVRTIKYDGASGTEIWNVTEDASVHSAASAVALDPSGNVVVTGSRGHQSIPTRDEFRTMKYNGATGAVMWSATYLGPVGGGSGANAVALDAAANVLVTGGNEESVGSSIRTIKYDGTTGAAIWNVAFKGSGIDDRGNAVAVDASGNILVTGRSADTVGNTNIRTIKYSGATGAELWNVSYDGAGSGTDNGNAVAVDATGNVVIIGSTYLGGSYYDIRTIKYNGATGAVVWNASYEVTSFSENKGHAVALDVSGNVVVTGYARDPNAGGSAIRTIKYNGATGSELWNKMYDGPPSTTARGHAVALDPFGDVLVTGFSAWSGTTRMQTRSIKYSGATGSMLWTAADPPVPAAARPAAMVVDPSGNPVVTGSANGISGQVRPGVRTIKYNAASGAELWSVTFNAPAGGAANGDAIAVDAVGDVAVTGYTSGDSGFGRRIRTVKYRGATGAVIWSAVYTSTGGGDAAGTAVAIDSTGNVVVTGYSNDSGSTTNIRTIKYNGATGAELWNVAFNGSGNGNDRGNAVAVDASGNILVTGRSADTVGGTNIRTIKYSGATGTELWSASYNGAANGDDRAHAIALDASGNVFVMGLSSESTGTFATVRTIKYDGGTGAVVWTASSGSDGGHNTAIALDTSGNVAVTGLRRDDSLDSFNTIKLNGATGARIWTASFTSEGFFDYSRLGSPPINVRGAESHAIAFDPSGQVIVAGWSADGSGGLNGRTIKYDGATGAQIWSQPYDGSRRGADEGIALALGSGGSIFVAGVSTEIGKPQSWYVQKLETPPVSNAPRLVNIATRMQVLTGDNVLIGGLIIGGSAPKTVVVRARGPSLTALGVPGALANPNLQLFSGQTQIAANDNFGEAANAAALQASGFAPSNSLESAILTTLAPGAYTAIVSGVGGTTGVGIVEVFEVDKPEVPLINIATRGQVLTGSDVMIGGFVIQGSGPQTVVVRARGPSLTALGVPNALANPVLNLYSGQTVIASNDNWQTAANAAALQSSGFAPSHPNEAAILITLNPGAYTAIVTGANGGTGVGIVEVFAR